MFKLIKPYVTPVGGFRYVDPDNGYKFERNYSSFDELAAHVELYRSQNKLPPLESFREVWENWVCQEPGMEKSCCPVSATVKRNFSNYLAFGKTLVRAIMRDAKKRFVREEIAEARAKTCVNCRSNVYNTGHRHSDFYGIKYLMRFAGGRRTKYNDKLFTCKICTCILQAKVFFRSADVASSLTLVQIGRLRTEPRTIKGEPLRCWQLDAYEKIKRGESDEEESEVEKEGREKGKL